MAQSSQRERGGGTDGEGGCGWKILNPRGFGGKQGFAVEKQSVAVEGQFENMEKSGIAVELRDCEVEKRGFAVVRRVSAVGRNLKTTGLRRSAVGKGCSAMEIELSAVERNGVAVWGNSFALAADLRGRCEADLSKASVLTNKHRKRQSRLTSIRTTPSGGARGCGAEIVAGVVGASLRVYQSGRLASCESPRIDSRAFYSLEVNEGSGQPDSVYNNSRKGAKF